MSKNIDNWIKVLGIGLGTLGAGVLSYFLGKEDKKKEEKPVVEEKKKEPFIVNSYATTPTPTINTVNVIKNYYTVRNEQNISLTYKRERPFYVRRREAYLRMHREKTYVSCSDINKFHIRWKKKWTSEEHRRAINYDKDYMLEDIW